MLRITMLLFLVVAVPACGGGGGGGGGEANGGGGAAPSATVFNDPGIETFPNEGNTHVPVGTGIQYNTDPPTSGNHYPFPQQGGFFQNPILPGFLVHSMEHGGVIIYYNPSVITTAQTNTLKALAQAHQGVFGQVVCVPRNDTAFPFILTAWTHWLRLTTFDESRINNFLALFLGKGPESPWGSPVISNVTVQTSFNSVSLLQVSDVSRPGSMTSNNGMAFPAEGTTFSIDLQASSVSPLPDMQSVRIVEPPAIVAAAEYNVRTGGMVFSIGTTTFPSVLVPPGAFHTVRFNVNSGGMATWSVDGSATGAVPFGNPSVSMELDARYVAGSGSAPDFFFRNLVVSNVVTSQ